MIKKETKKKRKNNSNGQWLYIALKWFLSHFNGGGYLRPVKENVGEKKMESNFYFSSTQSAVLFISSTDGISLGDWALDWIDRGLKAFREPAIFWKKKIILTKETNQPKDVINRQTVLMPCRALIESPCLFKRKWWPAFIFHGERDWLYRLLVRWWNSSGPQNNNFLMLGFFLKRCERYRRETKAFSSYFNVYR